MRLGRGDGMLLAMSMAGAAGWDRKRVRVYSQGVFEGVKQVAEEQLEGPTHSTLLAASPSPVLPVSMPRSIFEKNFWA